MPNVKLTLREIMKDKGVSQQELHERTGISKNTLSRWMNNYVQQVDLMVLAQILNALDCDLEDVLDYDPDMTQAA